METYMRFARVNDAPAGNATWWLPRLLLLSAMLLACATASAQQTT